MGVCLEGRQRGRHRETQSEAIVARDFRQVVHTVGLLETYAPFPAASSGKLFVAIAVKNDWELRQLNVKKAFIRADLDFNVFMKLPDGCGDKSCKGVKLNKSVYGLKQAGRRWAMHLGDVVRKGFSEYLSS